MVQQTSVVADPVANATQGGVSLPAGSTKMVRILNGGNVWVLTLSSTYSTFVTSEMNKHVPCGDLVIVVGTDLTHAVFIGANGSVETVW